MRVAFRSMSFFLCVILTGNCQVSAKTAGVEVRNAGVPGQNSREGRERFRHDVLDAHPQVVLLYFGMNDAVNEKKMLTPEAYIQNIAWMVHEARESQILPIVSTIQHVDAVRVLRRHPASVYGKEGPNGRIDRFNAALLQFTREQNVPVSDFETAFDKSGGATVDASPDGVHLRAAGYALLASTFLHAIPESQKQSKTIVAIGDSLTYGTPLRTPDHDSDDTYPAALEKLLNAGRRGSPEPEPARLPLVELHP